MGIPEEERPRNGGEDDDVVPPGRRPTWKKILHSLVLQFVDVLAAGSPLTAPVTVAPVMAPMPHGRHSRDDNSMNTSALTTIVMQAVSARYPEIQAVVFEDICNRIVIAIENNVICYHELFRYGERRDEQHPEGFADIIRSAEVHMMQLLAYFDSQHAFPDNAIEYTLYILNILLFKRSMILKHGCYIVLYMLSHIEHGPLHANPPVFVSQGTEAIVNNLSDKPGMRVRSYRFFSMFVWIIQTLEMYLKLPPGSEERKLVRYSHSTLPVDKETVRTFQTNHMSTDIRVQKLIEKVKLCNTDHEVMRCVKSWLCRMGYTTQQYLEELGCGKRKRT